MPLFENFPYTNFHDLNLDWILKTIKQFSATMAGLDDRIAEIVQEQLDELNLEQIVLEAVTKYGVAINVVAPPNNLNPADPSGTEESTLSIQGCIDYANAQGGGVVFFPAGRYLTGSLTLKSNVALIGFDMYTSSLTLKGGASAPLISGNVQNCFIGGLTFDGNAEVQVDDITNVALTCNNVGFDNVQFTGGYILAAITGSGGDIWANGLTFGTCVQNALITTGSGDFRFTGMKFNNLSAVGGVNVIGINTDGGIYDFQSVATCSVCCDISGDGNIVHCRVENAGTTVQDNGKNNQIVSYGDMVKAVYENFSLTVSGDVNIGSETADVNLEGKNVNVSGTDFKMGQTEPTTYRTPDDLNDSFKTIPFKDPTGMLYRVLVMGKNFSGGGVWIDAKESGCDNTGVSDCSALINTLLTRGKPLYFPSGTYLVSANINLPDNAVILCQGAVFKGSGNDAFCFFANGTSNILIVGAEITNFRRAFDFRNGENYTVIGAYAHDMYRDAGSFEDNYMMHFLKTKNILVSQCRWDNLNENGDFIRLKDGTVNAIIENCDILAGDDGIAIVPDEGVTTTQPCENVVIRNCNFNSGTFRCARIQSERSMLGMVTFENCNFNANRECVIISSTSSGSVGSTRAGLWEMIKFVNCLFNGGASVSTPHVKINTNSQVRNLVFDNCWFNAPHGNHISVENSNIYIMCIKNCRFLPFASGGGTFINMVNSDINMTEIEHCFASGGNNVNDVLLVVDGNTCTVYLTNNRLTGFEYLFKGAGNTGTANFIINGNLGGFNHVADCDGNTRIYGSIASNASSDENFTGSALGVLNGLIKSEIVPSSQSDGYVFIDGTNNKIKIRLNSVNYSIDMTQI